MNCNRCHEPIEEETAWKAIIDGHGRVDICDQCHVEHGKLGALSETLLRYTLRDWYEGNIESDSIPEFDEQRHRVLSLASGRMFELLAEMAKTQTDMSKIKRKMRELCEEIKEALGDTSAEHGWPIIGALTKEEALKRLNKLPEDVRTVGASASPRQALKSLTGAVNLNATLILLLGLILKQTIEGFPDDKPWYREDDPPCPHGMQ